METIRLRDEYIKLGQALKATGMVESGVEAKEVIQEGLVMVNGDEYSGGCVSVRNDQVPPRVEGQGYDPFRRG